VSDHDRPDLEAFRELEQLIRALSEEMDGWRRRAQVAESRLRELEAEAGLGPGGNGPAASPDDRQAALEHENRELRSRIDLARARTYQLLERMRFLRQQLEAGAER
jgi:hypothetical protein